MAALAGHVVLITHIQVSVWPEQDAVRVDQPAIGFWNKDRELTGCVVTENRGRRGVRLGNIEVAIRAEDQTLGVRQPAA